MPSPRDPSAATVSAVSVERVFPVFWGRHRVSSFCTARGEARVAPAPLLSASLEVEDLLWGASVRVATAGPAATFTKRVRAGPLTLQLAVSKAAGRPASCVVGVPPTPGWGLHLSGGGGGDGGGGCAPARLHFGVRPLTRPLTRGAGVEARGYLELPSDRLACDLRPWFSSALEEEEGEDVSAPHHAAADAFDPPAAPAPGRTWLRPVVLRELSLRFAV